MDTGTEQLAALLDREMVRDCVARLARGEDRRDAELIGTCFWPDATIDFGIFAGTFDEYLAWVVPGSAAIPVTQHVLGRSSRRCAPIEARRSGGRSPRRVMDADRLARLLDRQDILDCLTRFSRGMDRFDRELFLSAFHPDAVVAAGDFVGGPAELYAWASAMHAQGQLSTHHNLLNSTCEIDGETAHSETYYLFAARNRDETNWIAGGRYFDRLERRDGTWRIVVRTNVIEWSGMVPTMPIPFADVPDIHGNGAPSRSKADPSYQRPLINRRQRHNPLDI